MKILKSEHALRAVGSSLFVAVAASTVLTVGCFFGGGQNSNNGGDEDEAYTGTLVFQNQTSAPLCGVELIQREHFASHMDRVEPGASIELQLQSAASILYVTACDGSGFLFGTGLGSPITSGTFAFTDTSPKSFPEVFDYIRQIHRMNTNPVLQDAAVQAQMHEAVIQQARSESWADTPSVTLIASDAWSTDRHRRTGVITGRRLAGIVGHRLSDGQCRIQMHSFTQGHDGSNFSGNIRYAGFNRGEPVGCTMVDWMEARSGGTSTNSGASNSSGTSSSASCTNTCSSARDGECDDGGPGAEYSVCTLGTDCADCGDRSGGGTAAGAASGTCTNTCSSANDGECDDGGPGAEYSVCTLGTDCGDCGSR